MLARRTIRAQAGFTLLELITVMALISILAGIGVGLLGGGNTDMRLAWSVLQDQIRLAYEGARSSGRPSEVRFERLRDGPIQVQARVLSPVGHWHLEPNEDWFAGLVPDLNGVPVENGRYGHARRADVDDQKTLFAVATKGRSRFDLSQGFSLRLELRFSARVRCTVARLGDAFRLELDQDLVPNATLTLTDPGHRPGVRVKLTGEEPLPLDTWLQLELSHDGHRLLLVVDGMQVDQAVARGEAYQQKGDVFEVSPGHAPVHGLVDEIRLLAYELSEPQNLPQGVTLDGFQGPIGFDGRGRPRAPAKIGSTIELSLDGEHEKRSLAPGGVLK